MITFSITSFSSFFFLKWNFFFYRKGANRFLTVTKPDGTNTVRATAIFHLVRNSRHQVHTLLQRFPVTNKERQELLPRTDRSQANEGLLLAYCNRDFIYHVHLSFCGIMISCTDGFKV